MEKWQKLKQSGVILEKIKSAERIQPKRGNRGGRKNYVYPDIVCAFDIETSSHVERIKKGKKTVPSGFAWMYIWQFCLEDIVFYGRTWNEFSDFVSYINANLEENERLVTYVHNLSYEAQFLLGVFDFQPDGIFAMERRKIVKMFLQKIEFRCSYVHSNMSLGKFLEYMGVPDKKLTLDYSVVRYPWTILESSELEYCSHDVSGLCQAIRREMSEEGDTLQTIPLTSTGYVRRIAKKELEKISHYRIREMQPSEGEYRALKAALRGGDTHANRYYAGLILENLDSFDISSSYPFVMCAREMPSGGFKELGDITYRYYKELVFKRKRPVIARFAFTNLRLRDKSFPDPVLSKSKAQHIISPVEDNGRILSCAYCETWLTDIDFRIYREVYEWDESPEAFRISDVWVSTYALIPENLRHAIFQFFEKKTKLKGVDDYLYMKSKNKLNAFFGLSATDPMRDEWELNIKTEEIELKPFNLRESIKKQKNKISMPFSWGIWVTSWARYRLYQGIKIAGKYAVYWDTDSVKYIRNPEVEKAFAELNKKIESEALALGLSAESKNGDTYVMGVFDKDAHYERFCTLGAKKYAYEEKNKNGILELHTTIAGVSKKKGPAELGKLENFQPDFIFRDAAGRLLLYNDKDNFDIEIDGHTLHIGRNVCICDNTYKISLTPEYDSLIFFSEKMAINDAKYKELAKDEK